MAQIPLGNFGQQNVTPQSSVGGPDMRVLSSEAGRGAAVAAAALNDASNTFAAIAAQKKAEQEAQDSALNRIQAASNALDDRENVNKLADETYGKLISGEIDYTQAESAYQEALNTRTKPDVVGAGPVDKANYDYMLKQNEASGRQAWAGRVDGFKKDSGAAQVGGVFNKLLGGSADPSMDPDALVKHGAAMRDLWIQMGNDPQVFDNKFDRFKTDVYDDNFAANLNATIDNPNGLIELRKTLANGEYWGDRLGPEKSNTMIARIDSKIDSIKADQDRAMKTTDNLAKQLIGDVSDQLEIGQNPGDERLLQAAELATGRPELAERLQQAKAVGQVVSKMLERPKLEQTLWIEQERARLNTQGGTEKEYALLGKIETAFNRRVEARKNNPIGEMNRMVQIFEPINFSDINASGSDINASGLELNARKAALDAARKNNPDFGSNLLRPEEATLLTDAIKKTPPEQIPAFFGQLYSGTNDKVYAQVMQQVGGVDPVIASAGKRFAVDMKAERDPRIAVGIAKGRTLLTAKDKTITMPKDADIGTAFADLYGSDKGGNGAYAGRPDDYRGDIQSVKAYYANLTAEAGDLSGELDQKRWDKAIKDVIGSPINIEGYNIMPPIGVDIDKFETKAMQAIDEAVVKFGFNAHNDFGLRNVPGKSGYYYLINTDANGSIVRGKDGRTIGINLND